MKLSILILILLLPLVHAQESLDIKFDINADGSVTQSNKFIFSTPINGTLNYTISEQARNVAVFDGAQKLDVAFVRNGSSLILIIFIDKPTSELTIDYTIDDIIFRADFVEHFFTEFSFDNDIKNLTASVKLPVGYTIYENSYRPPGAQIVSDGRSIIILWQQSDVKSVLFSVKFVKPEQPTAWIAVIAILIGSLLFVYFYFRQRKKEDFLFGFRHDEKIAINYIQQKKIILQRDLEEEFKFSRAKATRVVSRLVEKGLVKKQRYGRTNKLTWAK